MYSDEEFVLLITPTIEEFTCERWNEYTNAMLTVYRLTSKEHHIRSFEYEANGFAKYRKTMVSERWYLLTPSVGNPYVIMFCFMCTTEPQLAKDWINCIVRRSLDFVGGGKVNLVYKHEGRLIL